MDTFQILYIREDLVFVVVVVMDYFLLANVDNFIYQNNEISITNLT